MSLKRTFEHYFPTGYVGGECGTFAHLLVDFPPVGNTVVSKTLAVFKYGIPREKITEYKEGDVILFKYATTGHVAVINGLLQGQLQLTESNYHLDHKVTHDRVISQSLLSIIGVIRGPLKVKIMPVQLPITLVANKNMWSTLQDQLLKTQEWFTNYSAGKLQVTFDVKHTDFQDVPKMPWQGTQAVDVGWYREQITHLATGKATILLLNPEQWGISGWGTMTYGDPGKPVRMEVEAIENEMNGDTTVFVPRAFHEICHMLFFLTGQPDRTHEFLLVSDDRKAALLALIDYDKLEVALNNIKPVAKIQIRYIGWTDQEKGIYFPFDSIERMKKVLDKLEADYPDYDFNPKEINLGKRPF